MVKLFLTSLLSLVTLHAEDWPQFRGQNASGISSSKGLPTEFGADKNLLWKAKLGEGVGSAIVKNGVVFASGMAGDSKVALHALDALTGQAMWTSTFDTGTLPRITPPNSHAASTPAADGERVYIHFSTIGLLAFDAATGREVWRYTMPRPAYLMDWGAAASPILHDGMVIFCQDDDLAPFLVAVDAKTGREKWKTLRQDMLAGYATPVICTAGGRTDLVVAGSGKMKGYDPKNGREIWTCNTLLRTIMVSPVVHGEIIYIAVQSYGDSTRTLKHALLEWLDTNQDKILAREETPKEFHDRFDTSDQNKNGLIDPDEIDTAFQSPTNMAAGGNIIQAIRGGGTGDVTATHLLWNLDHKTPSNISSPLLYRDQIYLVKSGGMSSSYSAKDGKQLWDRMRMGNFGDYFASPVAADGKVYFAGKNGFIVALEAGPEFKVISKHDFGEEIIATPSIVDGRLYVRTRENLFCVAEGGSGKNAPSSSTLTTPLAHIPLPQDGSKTWNGFTGDLTGLEAWGPLDLSNLLRELKASHFTTITFPAQNTPVAAIRVDGDTAGRKAFGGAATFPPSYPTNTLTRFRELAQTMGFQIIEAELQKASILPKVTFTDKKALSDLITPMCGEGVADRMWLGFEEIAKAQAIIAKQAPDLGIPAPDMLTRHLNSKESLPDWLVQVKTHYLTAMSEFYRANTRAREGSRVLTLYYAKKLEFAFHYASCLENLYKAHDTPTESLDAAIESIYNALNSLADAARDPTDRGIIALLNEHGYRTLKPLRAK